MEALIFVCGICLILFIATQTVTSQEEINLDFSIFENIGNNAFVGDVATEANLQNLVPSEYNNDLKFQLLAQNNPFANYFYINQQSGILRTNTAIDREQFQDCIYRSTCVLDVRFWITSENPDFLFTQIVDCHITIQDQNDNSPEFDEQSITRSLPEDTPVGSRIQLPPADDPDSPAFGISHYTLTSTNVPEFQLVQINGSNGAISLYLEVVQTLDLEVRQLYRVVVAAFDRGDKSGTVAVDINILDVNDNQPAFTQEVYSRSVGEDMRINDAVIRVTAVDEDSGRNGEIIYAFDQRTLTAYGHLFRIDNSTGEIILIGELDYETKQQFILQVTARELHHETLPVEAQVIVDVVDVNDNAPIITVNAFAESGNLEIDENDPVGTFIGLISTEDPDSGDGGRYTCTLENNNDNSFELTATSSSRSDFTLATNSNFDREVREEYELQFVCTDRGTPSRRSTADIRVTVLDKNDNAPHFTQQVYNVSISENNPPGIFLYQVHATDDDFGQNGQVEYDLYSEAMAYISVDRVSGNITAKIAFDYERYRVLSFGIIARDKGEEAHTTTAILNIHIINENDEPPRFEPDVYSFEIAENSGIMASIDQVVIEARDPGLASVIFQMGEDSEYADLFSVDSATGVIYTGAHFDADGTSSNEYSFHVLAIDSDNTNLRTQAFVAVTITDINDNAPSIHFPTPTNHTVHIGNDFHSGNIVTNIIASDNDVDTASNAKLRYILQSGEGDLYFSCNERTGEVRSIRSLRDINTQVFNLTITVLDMGTPSLSDQATLTISVNQSYSQSSSKNEGKEKLVKNDNITIVTTVAVISGVLIVFLLVAIVLLKRKDQIKFHNKQKRIAKLFSTQKVAVKAAAAQESNKERSFDSLDGVKQGYSNDVSTADEYQQQEQSKAYSEKSQKVAPWLNAQLKESADVSDVSEHSLGSDSGRGSHDDPDLTARTFQEASHQHPPSTSRGRTTPQEGYHQDRAPSVPPKHTTYYRENSEAPLIPERGQRVNHQGRARRDSHDSYVQLARTHKLPTQIAPDHKLLYKHPLSSPSHNVSSQSSGYSSAAQNYQLQMPNISRTEDAFLPSASYI